MFGWVNNVFSQGIGNRSTTYEENYSKVNQNSEKNYGKVPRSFDFKGDFFG